MLLLLLWGGERDGAIRVAQSHSAPSQTGTPIPSTDCPSTVDVAPNPRPAPRAPLRRHTAAVCDSCSTHSYSHSRSTVGSATVMPGGRRGGGV